MRLRLYRLDTGSLEGGKHHPLLIDRFPFSISDPAGWTPLSGHSVGFHECCRFDQFGYTLFVTDISSDESTQVNGCKVTVAPVLPGDRIRLNSTEFLISYERMTSAPPPSIEYLLQSVGHTHSLMGAGTCERAQTVPQTTFQNARSEMQPTEVLC